MGWVEAAWAKNSAKAYTDSAISAIGTNMTYKGSKATIADLPASGNKKGDLWNVTANGSEWVWTGSAWNEIGRAPTSETYTIASSAWSSMSGNEPFAWSTEIIPTYTIGANTVCELVNNNAVNFAKYGFAIGDIAGQSIKMFALNEPTTSVTIEVEYYG